VFLVKILIHFVVEGHLTPLSKKIDENKCMEQSREKINKAEEMADTQLWC